MAEDLARKRGIDPGALMKRVTDEHLLDIAQFIQWKDVGRRLKNIGTQTISDIDIDGHDQADRRSRLIDLWVDRNGDDATYHQMITAMLAANMKADAEKVCNLLNGEKALFLFCLYYNYFTL